MYYIGNQCAESYQVKYKIFKLKTNNFFRFLGYLRYQKLWSRTFKALTWAKTSQECPYKYTIVICFWFRKMKNSEFAALFLSNDSPLMKFRNGVFFEKVFKSSSKVSWKSVHLIALPKMHLTDRILKISFQHEREKYNISIFRYGISRKICMVLEYNISLVNYSNVLYSSDYERMNI